MNTDVIRTALADVAGRDFSEAASRLLARLGYESALVLEGQTGLVDDFVRQLPARNLDTATERSFVEEARSAHMLFQVTDEEIPDSIQSTLFESSGFNTGNARSFLFAAVELKGESYPRGRYASFAREVNKRVVAPTVVLFRTPTNLLTLAFVHRRANLQDSDRDVLGKVSLIREIKLDNPHRAHLDILGELSLYERRRWMDRRGRPQNFDGLLAAWLDALDTEELNRRFYRDLFAWFERAVKKATFPTKQPKTLKSEEHVMRLITRLMFVWFVKEKGMVAEDLFVENQVTRLLRDYDAEGGDSYYRAVLQNLFFATLNTEISRRGFSRQNNSTYRDFSRYRFKSEMADPDGLLALFKQTPFINGGLFDCLDSFESTSRKGYRIDCFSDVKSQRRGYSIPNALFFDESEREPGLITLFERYKFTVEENTPAEQEVALDPELLGKVFENLLAAYNPETRETARKQTGSYYTPREVVDYMVDEALVAALAQRASPKGDTKGWEGKLRRLLAYLDEDGSEAENDWGGVTDVERDSLVGAIAGLKVLDPAVGSGAFPMAVLHKLTLALRRLDPRNERWEQLQRKHAGRRSEAAFGTDDQQERDEELKEISATFERYRDSDFGRKLYLIQNSIYGVDIQPVATQIAKLRFFISLAIDQETDDSENYGIKPLPNLETRFVAADTLIRLNSSPQLSLEDAGPVEQLRRQLRDNREGHFHADTRQRKMRLRDRDRELRGELAKALRKADFPAGDARKVARWDPYDQNESADWFDAKYMFGVDGGFDVVVGNPPYVQLQKQGGLLAKKYKDAGYSTFTRTGDLYQLFLERACELLRPREGVLAYITSNSWLKAQYGKKTRSYLGERHTPLVLLEMGKEVFESVIVDASVLLLREGRRADSPMAFPAVDTEQTPERAFPPAPEYWGEIRPDGDAPWSVLSKTLRSIMAKMRNKGTPLKNWEANINRGILTGYNKAFIIDDETRGRLIAADGKSDEIIKPVLRGKDIQRYRAEWANKWLIDTHNGYSDTPAIDVSQYPAVKAHLDQHYPRLEKRQDKGRTPYNLRNCAFHEEFDREKLFWMHMGGSRGRFCYAESGIFSNQKAFMVTGESLKYLCAVLNCELATWFMKNTGVTTGMGLVQWDKFSVERIPIPKASAEEQAPIARLVDEILEAKDANPDADASDLEWQIDGLVYDLYGLTEEERTAVERSLGLIHATDEEEDAALAEWAMEGRTDERVSREEVMAILQDADGG